MDIDKTIDRVARESARLALEAAGPGGEVLSDQPLDGDYDALWDALGDEDVDREQVLRRFGERYGDQLTVLAIDWEASAPDWWDAAQADLDPPDVARCLLSATDGIAVTPVGRVAFLRWAASLPGWDTGDARAPHPVRVVRGELDQAGGES